MGLLNQAIDIKNVVDFYGVKNFVETGTGIGEVVQSVCEVESTLTIHTVEILKEIYSKNLINFSYLKNVTWHLGQSSDILPTIIPILKGNTLFWMDAHFPGADFGLASYGDEKDMNKRLPLQTELDIIVSSKEVSNDVFVIDDLRIYEDGPFEEGNWEDRKKYGGDGIGFIEEMFDDTHYIVKSYNKQGFVILLPVSRNIENEAGNLLVGELS